MLLALLALPTAASSQQHHVVGIVGSTWRTANNANHYASACAMVYQGMFRRGCAVGYVGTLDSQFKSLAKYTYGFTLHSYFT